MKKSGVSYQFMKQKKKSETGKNLTTELHQIFLQFSSTGITGAVQVHLQYDLLRWIRNLVTAISPAFMPEKY